MSDNILLNSTDLGVGKQMEPNMIEWRKFGKAILTIHADGRITVSEDCKPTKTAAEVLRIMRDQWMADVQCAKIRELQSDVNELKELVEYLQDRIRKLKMAGNGMYEFINPPSPCMRTSRMDNLLQGWDDAKIGKEVKP